MVQPKMGPHRPNMVHLRGFEPGAQQSFGRCDLVARPRLSGRETPLDAEERAFSAFFWSWYLRLAFHSTPKGKTNNS